MTKSELIKKLENWPDDWMILVPTGVDDEGKIFNTIHGISAAMGFDDEFHDRGSWADSGYDEDAYRSNAICLWP